MKEILSNFLLQNIPDINILFSYIESHYSDSQNSIAYSGWFGTDQGIFLVGSSYTNKTYIKDFSFVKIFNKINFIEWKNNQDIRMFSRGKNVCLDYWKNIKYVDNLKKAAMNNVKIFDVSKFNEIYNHQGVYIITFKSGKQYIGRSKTIRKRLYIHINKYGIDTILNFKIFKTKDYADAKKLERRLINDINPKLNIHLKPIYPLVEGFDHYPKWEQTKDMPTYVAASENQISDRWREKCKEFMIKVND